jgi:hypothetical protein
LSCDTIVGAGQKGAEFFRKVEHAFSRPEMS